MYDIIAEVSEVIWNVLSKEYLKNKTPQDWVEVAENYEKR